MFVDGHGLQRLKLRDLRKVTHHHDELVVSGESVSVRGKLAVDSAQIKAFFADVQTLRKRREAGLEAIITSAFNLHPPRVESQAPPVSPAPIEAPVLQPASEIPGFQLGLSTPVQELSAPSPRVEAPRTPPLETPASVTPPVTSSTPPSAATEPWAETPRVPKPNPRVATPVQKESLPPPKANPRVTPPVSAPPSTPAARVDPPPRTAPLAESTKAPEVVPSSSPAPRHDEPVMPFEVASPVPQLTKLPEAQSSEPEPRLTPSSKSSTPPPSVPRPQSDSTPRIAPSTTKPTSSKSKPATTPNRSPRALSAPKRSAPLTLPKFNPEGVNAALRRVGSGINSRVAAGGERVASRVRNSIAWDGLRRHMLAVLIDGAAVLLIAWIVTRIVGGRELETLLRFPSTVRLDTGLLQSLKDLLPAIIASALTAVLTSVAVGAAYMLGFALSLLRGTPGERVMGVEVTDVSGAPVTIAALGARYAVNVMLFIAPGILGLLPTLVSLSGPATTLRSTLTLFGFSVWVGVVLLLLGQLPVFGGRGQTLAEYLSDCKVTPQPKLEVKPLRPLKAKGDGRAARDNQV
ncbi:MAG: hypothetical protein HC933_11880 [Pleurocapsa sp. SU_196_0]|nr:hypothetical protein [Pleurocapsa sp. SU_196_0]